MDEPLTKGRVEALVPISEKGASHEIHEEILRFLCERVAPKVASRKFDVSAVPYATRIVVAFAAYDRTGSVEAFREALRPEQERKA